MKQELKTEIDKMKDRLNQMSDQLYHHPELGDQEFQSMQLITDFLSEQGFQIETNIVGRATAFKAEYDSGKAGPSVAFLAEYDALPEIGHGCGHNMIGAMASGAAAALSKLVDATGGSVVVLGTPAEETDGAKVPMSREGIFDKIDVAMILHAADESAESGDFAAIDPLQFTYIGKPSHAASTPEKGLNALDGVIQLFNGINALREHMPSDVRMHGIISEGGQAPNVVPERAVAKFYLRSKERSSLDEIVKKVEDIAKGAALMTGTTVDISNFEASYDNVITNKALSNRFTENLREVNDQPIKPAEQSYGSVDMGNVSKVVPAIHPFIGLEQPGLDFHTKEFADRTVSPAGHKALVDGALALAGTGYDVITDRSLLEEIRREFEENVMKSRQT